MSKNKGLNRIKVVLANNVTCVFSSDNDRFAQETYQANGNLLA